MPVVDTSRPGNGALRMPNWLRVLVCALLVGGVFAVLVVLEPTWDSWPIPLASLARWAKGWNWDALDFLVGSVVVALIGLLVSWASGWRLEQQVQSVVQAVLDGLGFGAIETIGDFLASFHATLDELIRRQDEDLRPESMICILNTLLPGSVLDFDPVKRESESGELLFTRLQYLLARKVRIAVFIPGEEWFATLYKVVRGSNDDEANKYVGWVRERMGSCVRLGAEVRIMEKPLPFNVVLRGTWRDKDVTGFRPTKAIYAFLPTPAYPQEQIQQVLKDGRDAAIFGFTNSGPTMLDFSKWICGYVFQTSASWSEPQVARQPEESA